MPPAPDTDQNEISATTARRLQLIRTGYAPIPLYGKEPPIYKTKDKYGNNEHGGLAGWQTMHAVTPEQARMWEKTWPDAYGTGLLSRSVPAGDIDILDLDAANAIETLAREHFEERGHMLFRFGMAPKRAFLLRTDEPFPKITSIVFAPDGSKQRIEILGDGEQLAAFGMHPGTGKPYSWFGGEPGQIAREDLPYVREADARAFVDEATRLLITEYGYSLADPKQEQRQKGNGHDQGEAWSFAAEARMREALAHIPANEAALTAKLGDSHSAFVNIGRAIERLDWGERGFNILRVTPTIGAVMIDQLNQTLNDLNRLHADADRLLDSYIEHVQRRDDLGGQPLRSLRQCHIDGRAGLALNLRRALELAVSDLSGEKAPPANDVPSVPTLFQIESGITENLSVREGALRLKQARKSS